MANRRTYNHGYWLAEPIVTRKGILGNQFEVRGLVVHEETRHFKSLSAAKQFIKQFGTPGSLSLNVESEQPKLSTA